METLEHRLVLSTFLVSNPADSGPGSLRWAIDQANIAAGADAIAFEASLADQPIVLGGTELSVSDDLTITGLGADDLTISGNNASRVFSIAAGVTVGISGVTIASGAADFGGGIYNEGTLTLADCTFMNNSAWWNGGAICSYSPDIEFPSSLTITNSTFTGNYADDEGGGIWNDGLLTLADTTFSANESWSTGGAIWNTGTVNITSGTFSGNQTTYGADGGGNGGAIANFYGGKLKVTGSTFSQNAAGTGAAIDNYGTLSWLSAPSELEISNSIFTENEAYSTGGAIWNDGPANIIGSRFEANHVEGWGGAILHYACTMTVSNCTFLENSSGLYSGAIDNSGFGEPGTETETVLKVFNSTFSGNSTGREGGAIENYYATLDIVNSTISGNTSKRDGGGIWNQGALNITNSTIFGNRAAANTDGSGTGGGLWNWPGYEVQVLNNTILAGNVVGLPGSDNPNDIDGTVSPASANNLIGDPATAGGLVHGENGNIVGDGAGGLIDIATVLDPNLADNGGPTLTHALVPDGPAVNAGDNTKAVDADGNPLVCDQRGEGFARIYAGTVDIGAFEEHFRVGETTAPSEPVEVTSEITVSAVFTDVDLTHTHTATWDWGDGTTSPGEVTEPSSPGLVTGSHTYAAGGIYTITLTVTVVQTGESDQSVFQNLVVYRPVEIDVKPGTDANSINLASNGVIAVVILTTDSFDASLVDASTVEFAGASAVQTALEDVDGDGDLDMVLHFRVRDTNLADLYAQLLADDPDGDGTLNSSRRTAAVSLTGQTATDEYFAGFDEVDLFLSGRNLRDFLDRLASAGAI